MSLCLTQVWAPVRSSNSWYIYSLSHVYLPGLPQLLCLLLPEYLGGSGIHILTLSRSALWMSLGHRHLMAPCGRPCQGAEALYERSPAPVVANQSSVVLLYSDRNHKLAKYNSATSPDVTRWHWIILGITYRASCWSLLPAITIWCQLVLSQKVNSTGCWSLLLIFSGFWSVELFGVNSC